MEVLCKNNMQGNSNMYIPKQISNLEKNKKIDLFYKFPSFFFNSSQ